MRDVRSAQSLTRPAVKLRVACARPSFQHLCGRHRGERRKASSDPGGVDRINEASVNTRVWVTALLFGNQSAYNLVPVPTCLTCVNAFPNRSLSAQPCFSLIDVSSMVQYFKGPAKHKLCFQFPSFPVFGMPLLICSHAGAGAANRLSIKGFQPSLMLRAAWPSFLTLCS